MSEAAERQRISRLLIIEDDEAQLGTLTGIMRDEGYEVIGCTTAGEALEQVRQDDIAVAILDLRLPDLSGTELLEKLRAVRGRIHVVIYTGYGALDSAKEALNLGAFAYVEKGGHPGELVRQVGRAFRAHLDRYTEDLEAAVARRTSALRAANQALRREIAERKRAEQFLRESEEKFSKAFLTSPNLTGISTLKDGRLIEVNRGYCQVSGYSYEELVGHSAVELGLWAEPGQRNELVKMIEESGRTHDMEIALRTKSGQIRALLFSAEAITLDDQPCLVSVGIDITERKQAEERLRESERSYRLLFERNLAGVYRTKLDGTILDCNESMARMFGYASGQELMSAQAQDLYFETGDRTAFIDRLRKEGMLTNSELRMRRKDGSPIDILENVQLVPEEDGRPSIVVGTIVDITERKTAERAVAEQAQRFRLLAQATHDAVCDADLLSGRMWRNDTYQSVFGASEEASIDDTWWIERVHPEDRAVAAATEERLLAGQCDQLAFEYRLRRPDGEYAHVIERACIMRDADGRPSRLVGALADVTEAKQAERALRESEERFRNIFENAPIGIYRTTPAGRILMANPALVDMLGYASFDELAQRDLESEGYPADYSRADFKQKIEGADQVTGLETAWARKDGGHVTVRENARVVRDGEGQVAYYEGTVEDITERKQAAQALRESELRYHELFNRMSSGVAVYRAVDGGADFVFVDFNRAGEQIDRVRREDVIGRRVTEAFPGVQKYDLLDVLRRVWRTGRPEHQPAKLYRDERISGWRENFVYRLPSGEVVAIYDDVTERRRVEKELRESEAKWRSLTENSPDQVMLLDREGRILFINRAAPSLTEEGLLGTPVYDYVPVECRADVKACFENVLQTGQPDQYETQHHTAEGDTWNFEARVAPVGHDGEIVAFTVAVRDVTERKRAEQALRDSEEKYRLVSENIPVVVYSALSDELSTSLFVSGRIEELTGYAGEEWLRNPKLFGDILYPADRRRVWQAIHEHRRKRRPLDVEYRIVSREGATKWIRDRATPMFDADGDMVRINGVMEDVTERKEAEEALGQSLRQREELERIVNRSPAVAFLWRAEEGWPVEYASENVAQFGYAPGDFCEGGVVFADLVHPDDLERVGQEVRRYGLEGREQFTQRYRIITRSGETRWIDDHTWVRRTSQGKVTRHQGIVLDITERKQAEQALRDSEQRYRALVDNIDLGISLIDTDYRIVMSNASHLKAFGKRSGQFVGQKCFAEFEKRNAICPHCPGARAMATGAAAETETEGVRDDGSRFPVRLQAFPVYDADGTPTGFIEVAEDITIRRRAEEELHRLHEELVRTSRQVGMAEVATSVLHNVGNVLNSLNVSAGLVNEKIRGSKVPGLAKAAALMSEHTDDLGTFITQDERGRQLPAYLAKLAEHLGGEQANVLEELKSLTENVEHVKNIISMQQSLAGMAGLVEPLRIGDLLDDLLKMDASSLQRYGIKVVREYEEIPPLTTDKHRVVQILVNLLRNAKDALLEDQGGDKRLTVRLRSVDQDRVCLQVADTGAGIAPEHLTNVFAYGFTTKEGGHGFGLHSSALVARELGGSLTAHSDGPGQGATLTLELPLQFTRTDHAHVAS